MITVKKEGVLLDKAPLGFECDGVLNPAVIKEGNDVHVFYIVVSKGNYSSIGYGKLKGPLEVEIRHDTPVIFPQCDYETHGVEDPRIVKIEESYYLTYTAYDGVNALGALGMSDDLKSWHRWALLLCRKLLMQRLVILLKPKLLLMKNICDIIIMMVLLKTTDGKF